MVYDPSGHSEQIWLYSYWYPLSLHDLMQEFLFISIFIFSLKQPSEQLDVWSSNKAYLVSSSTIQYLILVDASLKISFFNTELFNWKGPKFINIKDLHFWNIFSTFLTLEVLKLDKSKYLKFVQPENIDDISETWEVSKIDKFIDFNLEQSLNKWFKFWREEVFIFPKLIFSKLEQPQNISFILTTLEVLKSDKSIDFNLMQFLNKAFIFVTKEVLIFPNFSFSKLEQP